MAKYDVFANPSGAGYVLDVQTDLLSDLNTRVVVPLMPVAQAPKPAKRLNPEFVVAGDPVVMVTQFLAAVPVGVLGRAVGNLKDHSDRITGAIDMVMQGF